MEMSRYKPLDPAKTISNIIIYYMQTKHVLQIHRKDELQQPTRQPGSSCTPTLPTALPTTLSSIPSIPPISSVQPIQPIQPTAPAIPFLSTRLRSHIHQLVRPTHASHRRNPRRPPRIRSRPPQPQTTHDLPSPRHSKPTGHGDIPQLQQQNRRPHQRGRPALPQRKQMEGRLRL